MSFGGVLGAINPVGLIANAGSGLLSYHGQMQTNRSNETIAKDATAANQASAREQMQFQNLQARLNEQFQTRMSNTAYQRAVADLKQAGLNPLLAVPGGASSPSGSAPSGSSAQAATTTLENAIAKGLTSASEMASIVNQSMLTNAQVNLLESQKAKTDVDALTATKNIPEAEIKNEIYDLFRPLIKKMKNSIQNSSQSFDLNKLNKMPVDDLRKLRDGGTLRRP